MTWRSNLRALVVISIVLMASVSPSAAKVIYVDANAPGFNNGSSWDHAYNYLQDALTDASADDKILVANGIYRPDEDTAHPYGTGYRTATFLLKNGVAVYGGFKGYVYTAPPPPMRLSNTKLTTTGGFPEAVLKTRIGSFTEDSYEEPHDPDPNVRDIELYETILSGDLNNDDTNVNSAWDLWGNPTRYDNSIHVVTGSGTDDTVVLDGFTITAGYADGTGINSCGGGMFNNNGNPTVTNCKFKLNSAITGGGGMHNWESSPTLIYCTFSENSAMRGGGMSNELSNIPILINCMFIKNYATGQYSNGGGIYNGECSTPILVNCIFTENSADSIGGGVRNGFYTRATLINCTFTFNSAGTYGGAIYWDPGPGPPPICSVTRGLIITNCILWDNSDSSGSVESAQIYSGSTLSANYNCIQGWTGALGGIGNIDVYPCFADANNGDYHLKSQAGRWDANSESWVRDDVTSTCIDAGNPGCPLGDEQAPNGNRINMGAYGGTAEASKSPSYWRSIADMTNDWVVDSNDLKVFADYWLQTGECIPSDFDRNQFVNFNDFAILGGQWRQKDPGPGITYNIGGCIPVDLASSAVVEFDPTRFTVTVKGRYIYFEDIMRANCCPEELDVQMTLEDNLITIYEIEHTPMPCPCLCDFPITATFGPFEPGIYILAVYQNSSFIGSTTVTIKNSQ
jgi:hypothetical protein